MTRHEDTPQRRADMIRATPVCAEYPAAQLAVAVMEDESTADIWRMVVSLPTPLADTNRKRAEAVAGYVADLFAVATVAEPRATLAADAAKQMSTPDFVRYCADRLRVRHGANFWCGGR